MRCQIRPNSNSTKLTFFSSCIREQNFGSDFINLNVSPRIMAPKIFCNLTSPLCPSLNLMLNKDYHSETYLFLDVARKDLKSIKKLILCAVFIALLLHLNNFIIMVLPQQTLIIPCFCLHRCCGCLFL